MNTIPTQISFLKSQSLHFTWYATPDFLTCKSTAVSNISWIYYIISNCILDTVYKLTKDATPAQMRDAGLDAHYASHDSALFYHNASGVPFTTAYIAAKGDPIADLYEDVAADGAIM